MAPADDRKGKVNITHHDIMGRFALGRFIPGRKIRKNGFDTSKGWKEET